ncbi:hypothetical protein [Streptomyces spongiae]|uniref:hypothetical protein n=1 Tax=Streptomyces spongiae TaxID=565072 RepID=UPI00128E79F8|nr:hypothetical protein [Streptomyces spongiae]
MHARLAGSPLLTPVAFGEGRRFGLWDLASLTEGALGTCVGPGSLTVSAEKQLRLRRVRQGAPTRGTRSTA